MEKGRANKINMRAYTWRPRLRQMTISRKPYGRKTPEWMLRDPKGFGFGMWPEDPRTY